MIKTFCDLCGKEITCADFQVTAEFPPSGYMCDVSYFDGAELHYHQECAKKVLYALEQMRRAAEKEEA